jgi:hypothetical protein
VVGRFEFWQSLCHEQQIQTAAPLQWIGQKPAEKSLRAEALSYRERKPGAGAGRFEFWQPLCHEQQIKTVVPLREREKMATSRPGRDECRRRYKGKPCRLKTAATRGHKEEHRMNSVPQGVTTRYKRSQEEHRMNSVLPGATTRRGGTRCARGQENPRAGRRVGRA